MPTKTSTEAILAEIIQRFGYQIIESQNQLLGVIKDLFAKDTLTLKLLELSIKADIPRKVLSVSSNSDIIIQKKVLVQNLIDDCFIQREIAERIVSLWIFALNPKSETDIMHIDTAESNLQSKCLDCISAELLSHESNNSLFFAKKNNKWGMIDFYGKELIPFTYDNLHLYQGIAIVGNAGKYGVLDYLSDRIIVPLIYEEITYIKDGFLKVKKNKKCGIIDISGEIILSVKYTDIINIYDKKDVFDEVAFLVCNKGVWNKVNLLGVVNRFNKQLIPIKYDEIDHDFVEILKEEGLIRAKKNGKWGFLDKSGKEIIPFVYENVWNFKSGSAFVSKDQKWGSINPFGNLEIEIKYDEIWDYKDLVFVTLKGKSGIYSEWNMDLKYDGISDFNENFSAVSINKKWGYINQKGREIIPIKYESTWGFSYGYARVKLNGKWGYLDKTGTVITEFKYTDALDFDDSLFAAVCINKKWGIIDRFGNEIIQLKYDDISNIKSGFFLVQINQKWGYIDANGKMVVPIKYDQIWVEKDSYIVELNGCFGLLDIKGKEVIPITYDSIYINESDSNLAYIRLDKKMGVFNILLKQEIVPPIYDKIFPFFKEFALVEKHHGFGIIDKNGNKIHECIYENLKVL